MKRSFSFKHTIISCYIGFVVQAIIVNFLPLLFVTFQKNYSISLDKIAILVFVNFGVQLIIDLLAAQYVERIGYRLAGIVAHVLACIGLVSLSFLPDLMPDPYIGILMAVVVYAIGGGLLEVILSPIVEAAPTENKSAQMSLLHSFYCWGHVFVVIASTVYFTIAGIDNWRILSIIWACIPLLNGIFFCLVPIRVLNEESGGSMSFKQLFSLKGFWGLCLMMVCAGASEQAMSQWASAFAETGLQVSKTVGDLAGPCMFAIAMGSARTIYAVISEKVDLLAFMKVCCLLCVASYLLAALSTTPMLALIGCALCGLSVGILWPGTISMSTGICSGGGTAMFALLALAGDLGCSSGPALVGIITTCSDGKLQSGLLLSIVFPIVMLIALIVMQMINRKKSLH